MSKDQDAANPLLAALEKLESMKNKLLENVV